ncbi:MAG: cystathionine beta-lyase [Hyphomicrobiales bacterium]|nr:cystathionine beta-lyase [Hyphomicrobiales bacterium]
MKDQKLTTQDKFINYRLDTRLARAGNSPGQFHGFINPPVVHASTVLFPDYETMKSRDQKYTYATRGTPTTDALSDALDQLEGSAGTIIVPTGLAAVTVPMLAFAKAGDHCLIVDSIYGPSRTFANSLLHRMGMEIEYFDPHIGAGFGDLLRENTSMVLIEAPGSNTFEMLDVSAIAEASHQVGAVVMMDNTWATPLFFKPLDHGVDISIHALTKYPGGHCDLLLGSVSANERCWNQLLDTQYQLGVCAQGDDCFRVLRGMRTMKLRLQHHEKSALHVAEWLDGQNQVARVLHPALKNDPGHEIWKRDFSGSSGLFAFVLKDASETQVGEFLDALQLFELGYSWGGYTSLAVAVDTSDRTIAKAPQGGRLIRLQIGLEDTADLVEDIEQALRKIRQVEGLGADEV